MTVRTEPNPEPTPKKRGCRRWVLRGAGVTLCLLALVVASVDTLQEGTEPVTEPWAGALPVAPSEAQALQPGADTDGDGLDDALEAQLARRFAPRLRFAAHDPSGPDSAQNQDELYLPLSVGRFLTCLDAGIYRARDGTVRVAKPGRFEDGKVVGFPSALPGDPIGEAPLYTHVYPSADGEVVCEYWVFYSHDRADATVFGVGVPYGGHRGDWEHTAYRIRLDPPTLLEGFYYGHGSCLLVPGEDIEVALGTHPVVYVSQGKHASYPVACVVPSTPLPQLVVGHLDVANGRGPSWDTWTGALVDLGERERPRPEVARWLDFKGEWGPDGLWVAGVEIGTSPTGPAAKGNWGNNGAGTLWSRRFADWGGRVLTR